MEEPREDNAREEKSEDRNTEEIPDAVEEEETEQSPDQEMMRMQQEVEEANDTMLRLAAELDNYKKRVAKERESLIKYSAQAMVQGLLPVLDNLERAIESADKSKDFDSFLEGVKMIYKSMYDALERNGVVRVDALGEAFDPNIHEAVMQVNSEEHKENVVVQELQKGYMLHDRVIRPTMVVVSRGAKEEEE